MGKKVLIVDDSKFMRTRLKKQLLETEPSLEIFEGDNGQTGLNVLHEQMVDLVMSDVNMPVMDGVEFIQNVFRNYPDLPIIVLTANPDKELKFDFMAHNVRAFISKLHPIEKIAERVVNVLGRHT